MQTNVDLPLTNGKQTRFQHHEIGYTMKMKPIGHVYELTQAGGLS